MWKIVRVTKQLSLILRIYNADDNVHKICLKFDIVQLRGYLNEGI